MQIRVLGPLEASVEDRSLPLGGAKQRALLAMLALEANRTVSADRLIEGIWGADVPASAPKMLQNYIWRLRGALAEDGGVEIVTHGRGYELRIDPELVDVRRLERLVAEADGNGGGAAREALALFRGDPLTDLADEPFAASEIRRLEELRLSAEELALNADLAAGRHQAVIGDIEALLARNPLRERLHSLRMLALYRCGRQGEALEAYREARSTLIDQIGVEPGPELRRLHDAILRQDESLDAVPYVAELPRELDLSSAPPLIGRDGELRRLQVRWRRAAEGVGALITLTGAYGMGKTRLAAALAAQAHGEDATVLYATGTGAPEIPLAAIAQVRDASRPTLLVLDDADRAPAEVRAAIRELAQALARVPALVLATGQESAALARLGPRDSVALEPLDADAVRLIAALYAPSAGHDDVPVETLRAASRGIARRVHDAAGEWARREATQRVDAAADRTAAGRSAARALQTELAGNVVDLQVARERAGRISRDPADTPMVCPYKGLATFDVADADYFFGREQLVADLVARLVGSGLLGVVGASGSGKSSAVRAGLLPALAGGVLPGSDGWTQLLIRPGDHPMGELTLALGRLGDRRGVLVVDQFEELFTACRDERERADFVAGLVRAAKSGDVTVVLALRADFYGRCGAYPELAGLLGENQVLVGPLSADELRRAIELPARRVGLSVEPELVDALLADVEGQAGALPLLSTALLELWRLREGRHLRLAAYSRSGGVQGAVARLAEDAFLSLDGDQQLVARNVLLRLAGEGEGGAIVRRRAPLSELAGAEAVVARLTDRRLLTTGDGAVEVAHEALLREWPRLRGWLDEDVHGRRLHRQISDAANAWEADARDPGGLYRGARLSAALEWRAGHDADLNAGEREFLDAGRAAAERANRRLRLVLGGVSLLLVVAVLAGLVALDQREKAGSRERAAESQRLAALALSEPTLDRSLLLARQAVALDDDSATRNTMLAALLRSPAATHVMRGDGGRMLAVAVRPDGRMIVAGDNEGRIMAFDPAGRRLAPRYQAGRQVQAIRFSPDGTRIAVAAGQEFFGVVDLLDGSTLRRIARHRFPDGLWEPVRTVEFSPDSKALVTAHAMWDNVNAKAEPGMLSRFDARTGRRLGRPAPVTKEGVPLIGFVGAGRLATMQEAEREFVIRDARTLAPIRRVPVWGLHVVSAISPDGRFAGLAREDGSLRIADLRTGKTRNLPARHGAPVESMAFSNDGATLVTGGDDEKVVVWDVRNAQPRAEFEGHSARVTSVALSRDGRTVYSASLDGTVIAWNLDGSRQLGRQFTVSRVGNAGPRFSETLSGSRSATISWNFGVAAGSDMLAVGTDRYLNVVDGRTLRGLYRIPAAPPLWGTNGTFAPDGRTLAITTAEGALGFWDSRARRWLRRPQLVGKHGWSLWLPQYSGDGHWLAVTGNDHQVRLWDARRFVEVRKREFPVLPRDMAMRPDGKVLAVPAEWGQGTGRVTILAVPSLKRVAEIRRNARWSSFSRDGKLLVVGDNEGRAQVYDGHTFKPRGRPLVGHAGTITTADFSPDGKTVATGSGDGTVRLWDSATGRPIARPLPGLPNIEVGVRFTHDGSHLIAVYDTGLAYRWDVRPSSWLRRACEVAGRTLTRQEWGDVLPGRKYQPACRA